MLVMDDVLSTHLINKFEQKYSDKRFVRVDSDVVDNLIPKEEEAEQISYEERMEMSPVFQSVCPEKNGINYIVDFKAMGEQSQPMVVTRNELCAE